MYLTFKRLADFLSSMTALIVLSPLLLVLTLILFFVNKGKPFFRQERPGKDAKLFSIIKFKTMNDNRDLHGNLLPDTERMTRIGGFIRKYSLDELLQLVNVVRGDMSIVGPRPLLVKYLPLYNETQARRHEVKPGITGLAQVRGRKTLEWKERFELDVWYVDNISFILDLKILWKTIFKVLKKEGVNPTIPAFKGNS